jgi:peptidoglycan/LPS O-acetylase OafA/YrhL
MLDQFPAPWPSQIAWPFLYSSYSHEAFKVVCIGQNQQRLIALREDGTIFLWLLDLKTSSRQLPHYPLLSTNKPSIPERLICLDVARGLASLVVVFWHWQHFFMPNRDWVQGFERSQLPLYRLFSHFYNNGGHVAVSFFFTLSGFVFFWLYKEQIASRACSLHRFATLRFARLYPLHFLTLLLVLLLQTLYFSGHSHYFVYQHNDARHFVMNLLFASNWGFESGHSFNGPIWSVSMEVGLYAIFFLVSFLRIASPAKLLLIIASLITFEHFHSGWIWEGPLEAFFIGGLSHQLLFYYYEHRFRSVATDSLIVAAATLCWLLFFSWDRFSGIILYKLHLYSRFLFPLTIAALVLLECAFKVRFHFLKWLGDITYSTYLLHFPLQLLFVLFAAKANIPLSFFYSPWSLALFMAILIPLSLLAYHYFELPMQIFLRKRLLPSSKKPIS